MIVRRSVPEFTVNRTLRDTGSLDYVNGGVLYSMFTIIMLR